MRKNVLKRRACCALLAAALCFSGCGVSDQGNYEVLGEVISGNTPAPEAYDFPATLRQLYPTSDCVVIAQIQNLAGKRADVLTVKALEGNFIAEDEIFEVDFSAGPLPSEGMIYLLFLQEEKGVLRAQTDEAGLIAVEGDQLIAQTGTSISLSQAMADIDKIQNFVYIPSYFTYYRELEELVSSSAMIFTGTVEELTEPEEMRFYVREAGLEEITTSSSVALTILPQEFLKGFAEGELQVILSDDMYVNTTIGSTLDQAAYSKENMPAFEVGMQYLFFLIESPAGKHGNYYLLVNPFQGYVPLFGEETLIPIPINAPFSYMQEMEELRMDVEAILSGEYSGVEYSSFDN